MYITLANGMVLPEVNSQSLDWLFQKLLRYEHHAENYKLALDQQIIPFGLRINKAPAIQTIFEHFNNQWNTILYDSEKRLIRLLLEETQKVVEKTRTDFNKNLEVNYPHHHEEEKNLIIKRNEKIKRKLEIKRRRKRIKFRNKRLTTRSNLDKEPNKRVTSNTKVEIVPVDIVLSNEDQQGNFPTAEQLKIITDNRHQRKKSRTYADAVVNIPDDPAVSSRTNELSKSKMDNKTVVTSKELRGIYDMLISDEPNAVDSFPPILTTNTSISENTSASYSINGSRLEVVNKNNSVSRLDEELISILVDLQSDDSKQNFAIGNSVVRSEGLPTKATITDEGRLAGTFCSKTVFNLSQRALSGIEIQVLEKGLDFSPVQRSFNEPELRKDFEELLGKCVLNGTFETNLQNIFLIHLHFVLNPVGNLLLVILVWSYF